MAEIFWRTGLSVGRLRSHYRGVSRSAYASRARVQPSRAAVARACGAVAVLGVLISCGVETDDGVTDDGVAEGGAEGDGEDGGAPCADAPEEMAEWRALEDAVLTLVNMRRAEGATCAPGETFEPAPPLARNALLVCAARGHSLAMGEGDFFDHQNPITGTSAADRVVEVGYAYSAMGENIAAGYPTAQEVVAGWMESPGHCANISSSCIVDMNPI